MSTREPRGAPLATGRLAVGWVVAVLGPVALTALLLSLPRGASVSFEAMFYLALAVGCALVGGRWPAVASSVLGTLCLNYFFTPPRRTLDIASTRDLVTLVLFLLVSLAVAAVVDSAARRRERAARAEAEARTLATLNRTVLGGEYDVPGLLALVGRTFGAAPAELVGPSEQVGLGDTVVPAGPDALLVLRDRTLDRSERRILAAFASHLRVLQEREELARQTAAARELEAGNRTRTALLAAVSHDLRTPLAGIRSASETLQRHGDQLAPEDRAELLTAIEQSTLRLTVMVSDLLDMSRLQTGAVQPALVEAPLGEVVARALAGLPGASRIEVGDLPAALVDPGLLERVVANLAANALRHSEVVSIQGAREGRRVRLCVVDHGPGVPAGDRALMFEPFQRLGDTAADEGVGLGLAVARGLTEAQGGSLVAEDTPGGGLTMVVELTVGEAGVKILIVDDDLVLRRTLAISIRAEGHDVLVAADGRTALEAARDDRPDLMVLDLGLPDLSGVQVLRELRRWSRLPVVVLSARNGSDDKVAALDEGADDYVTKPFGNEELLARIRATARRSGSVVQVVETESLRIDVAAGQVTRDGAVVRLTPTEWGILEVLVRRPGRLVTQRDLLHEVWGPGYARETNYLRVHMGNLRKKLEADPSAPRHLVTEPGMGYRFEP